VSATSIVRLERGLPFLPVTLVKVCEGLGLHVNRFLQPDSDPGGVKLHKHADDEWFRLERVADGPIEDANQRGRLAERERISPLLLFKTHLEDGSAYASLIEVYQHSQTREHPGEEFIYVLEGSLDISIAGKTHRLEAGECVSFWASEPHMYSPAPDSALPVRLLCVLVASARDAEF
jgi:mannose-6-phosphate isomerase-like protein (cupin superfamily)